MRKIATINAYDDKSQEEITIYASLNNGVYDIVLSNGNDTGLPAYETLGELERSVDAAWGDMFTFLWNLE